VFGTVVDWRGLAARQFGEPSDLRGRDAGFDVLAAALGL